jgi:eukaryotic-like serine/threonine-protein kinase
MARILKGVRRSDGMAVAFKYLMLERLSRYASKDTLTALFLNEGRLLSERLDHPRVIRGFDYGVAEGEYFIVLEYIEGSSLLHMLEKGALDLSQFRVTGMKILDGLEYIHGKGVIHRDLNPKNILVGNGVSSGVLKLIDFGLALEKKGGYMAPPGFKGYNGAYTSPQQKESFNDVDERDDIYSMGVVFYEMLGGRIGNRELDAEALAVLPEAMRGAVGRCAEKERDKRWKNVGELRRALFGAS